MRRKSWNLTDLCFLFHYSPNDLPDSQGSITIRKPWRSASICTLTLPVPGSIMLAASREPVTAARPEAWLSARFRTVRLPIGPVSNLVIQPRLPSPYCRRNQGDKHEIQDIDRHYGNRAVRRVGDSASARRAGQTKLPPNFIDMGTFDSPRVPSLAN
jgi:hypothetical protein